MQTEAGHLTSGLPTADLTACDLKPIHIPGSIQPHGVLVALTEADFRIVLVSINLAMFAPQDSDAMQGASLAALIDARGFARLCKTPGQARRHCGGAGHAASTARCWRRRATVARVDATATATAIEQQGAAGREMARTVQSVAESSERTAAATTQVAVDAERGDALGPSVPTAASDVAKVASTLRTEFDQFLHATAAEDGKQGQQSERVSSHDTPATLTVSGVREIAVTLCDISRGCAALRSTWTGDVGTPLELALPGSPARLAARLVRHGGNIVAITFRQDEHTIDDIDGIVPHLARDGAVPQAA
jgi:hypothetical protein